MVAQAVVEARGYCVMEPAQALFCCGRCRTVQGVKRRKGTDQLDCWFRLRDQYAWRYSEAYGMACPACCAIVCPWALESGWEGGSDSFKSSVKREVAASRLRGGQVTAAKRASQPVAQPSANERQRRVKR